MRSNNLLNILLFVATPFALVGAEDTTLLSTTSISTQTITHTVSQVVATATVTSSSAPASSSSTTEQSSPLSASVNAFNTTTTSMTAYITSSVYSGVVPMPSQNGTTLMSTGGQPAQSTTISPPINNAAATPALDKNVAIACLAGMLTLGVVFAGAM